MGAATNGSSAASQNAISIGRQRIWRASCSLAAAKGLRWESPRGPMSIDPETRDVVQTVYIRRVQKVGGELVNVPFDRVLEVKDPDGERRKKK